MIAGANEVAQASARAMHKSSLAGRKNCWLPIYYSVSENKVSVSKENDTFTEVTALIRENTPEEIEDAIKRYLWM